MSAKSIGTMKCCLISFLLAFVVVASARSQDPAPFVVFDPGHGGIPGGAPPNDIGSPTPIADYYEKDVNLDVSLVLKQILDFFGFEDS